MSAQTSPEREIWLDDPPPVTPFELVDAAGLMRLRYYAPAASATRRPPVLIVYSLIKRPYILDLLPDRSVVRTLSKQGYPVYLTDWLPPLAEDASDGLSDYICSDLARAVQSLQRREQADRVSLIGCCFGGLLAAIYAALFPRDVRHLIPFALPFDFRLPLPPSAIDSVREVYGNVPAWMIRAGLNAWVPTRAQLPLYLAEDLGEPESATSAWTGAAGVQWALARWLGSDVPLAGRVFTEIVRDAYFDRKFAQSHLRVGGRRVVLANIVCPVLSIVAARDRLVPRQATERFVECVGSRDASNLVFPTGHLGLMVSRKAHESLWPQVGDWMYEHGGS